MENTSNTNTNTTNVLTTEKIIESTDTQQQTVNSISSEHTPQNKEIDDNSKQESKIESTIKEQSNNKMEEEPKQEETKQEETKQEQQVNDKENENKMEEVEKVEKEETTPIKEEVKMEEENQIAEEEIIFDNGVCLWAKQPGYPWWPAKSIVISQLPSDKRPQYIKLLDSKKPHTHLVQYFNDKPEFAWLTIDNMRSFREHFEMHTLVRSLKKNNDLIVSAKKALIYSKEPKDSELYTEFMSRVQSIENEEEEEEEILEQPTRRSLRPRSSISRKGVKTEEEHKPPKTPGKKQIKKRKLPSKTIVKTEGNEKQIDLGSMIGMTFNYPMPIEFKIDFEEMDSSRVKQTADLLLSLKSAVEKNDDVIGILNEMIDMPVFIDHLLNEKYQVGETLTKLFKNGGNLEIVTLAEKVFNRLKLCLDEAISSGEYAKCKEYLSREN
ncbi:PWWP domain-containing protein [Entamoeba marina]